MGHRIKMGCGNLPENAHGGLCLCLRKADTHVTHARTGSGNLLPFDDLQHRSI